MPLGFLVNGLNDLIGAHRKGKANARGEESLEAEIKRILAQSAATAPSQQQQAQMQRQSDPLQQLLGGIPENPQQSPLGTGQPTQQQQNQIAAARALQNAKQGTSGLEYLLGVTDPMAQAQLAAKQQGNRQALLDYSRDQQAQRMKEQQQNAYELLVGDMPAEQQNLYNAAGPVSGTDALLDLQNPSNTTSPFGQVSPNQFTADSLGTFQQTGQYNDLVRHTPKTYMINEVPHVVDPNDPTRLVPQMTAEHVGTLGGKVNVRNRDEGGVEVALTFVPKSRNLIPTETSPA